MDDKNISGAAETNEEELKQEQTADTAEEKECEDTAEEVSVEEQPVQKPGRKEKKAKKLEAELEAKDKTIAELTDQYKRTIAEFDNFRKRSEKEKAARFDMGIRNVAERILPVVDNFERGLAALTDDQKKEAFADGMEKTYRQMMSILEDIGIVPIEAVGKPFNPDLHNAVMHCEDETLGENIIAQELQKGYTYNGSVVRYSMVKVAN